MMDGRRTEEQSSYAQRSSSVDELREQLERERELRQQHEEALELALDEVMERSRMLAVKHAKIAPAALGSPHDSWSAALTTDDLLPHILYPQLRHADLDKKLLMSQLMSLSNFWGKRATFFVLMNVRCCGIRVSRLTANFKLLLY